jgi:hypothetical protein
MVRLEDFTEPPRQTESVSATITRGRLRGRPPLSFAAGNIGTGFDTKMLLDLARASDKLGDPCIRRSTKA